MNDPTDTLVVTVILATYNGEKYLPQQLASLAAQSRRPDRIVLRDDGSVDRSIEMIQAWANLNNIELQQVYGHRLGPALSFLSALEAAKPSDLYMFCDQDDVWLPDKIARAMANVECTHNAAPTLYATRLEVVDASLNRLSTSKTPSTLSFSSAVCESVLTGCTMAFNAPFQQRLSSAMPRFAVMHDWWCYLVATGTLGAKLHFDDAPTMLYRQHDHNAMGAEPKGLSKMQARIRQFVGSRNAIRSRQLAEFSRLHYTDLDPEALRLINQLLPTERSFRSRLRASLCAAISRQSKLNILSTRIALLTNRY